MDERRQGYGDSDRNFWNDTQLHDLSDGIGVVSPIKPKKKKYKKSVWV